MQRAMNLEELTKDYTSSIKSWNKERSEMQDRISQQDRIISVLQKRAEEAEGKIFELALIELKHKHHK